MSDLQVNTTPWIYRSRMNPLKTWSGHVVYKRPKHEMDKKDAARIYRATRSWKTFSEAGLPSWYTRADFDFLQWHEFIAWGIQYGMINPSSLYFETVKKDLPNQWAWDILTGILDFVDPTDKIGYLVKQGAYWLIEQVEGAYVEKTLGGGVVPSAIYQAVQSIGDYRYPWKEKKT